MASMETNASAEPDARRPDGGGPGYWSLADTARYLAVCTKTVSRLIARDATFPAITIGGVVRINQSRLLVWLVDLDDRAEITFAQAVLRQVSVEHDGVQELVRHQPPSG